jgi:mRNA interferase RelE/StbE
VNRYTVYVIPSAWKEIKNLPGNMKQRVRRVIGTLPDNPRPANGKKLDTPDLDFELHRIRLDRWRIVYAISEADSAIDVLTVRKRPPYDYGDLEKLAEEIQ